jgi:thiol-disulfide isomerase/thioredoxin
MLIKPWINYLLFFVSILSFACHNNSNKKFDRQKNSLSDNIGDTFRLPKVLDSSGNNVALDFSKSEITIIDFWNNSCPPCIDEMKQFKQLLIGKERKISVISISVNQYWLWKKTLAEHKGIFSFLGHPAENWSHFTLESNLPEKMKNDFSFDRIDELQKTYNVTFFPAYFVVDRNGVIQSRPESAVDFIKTL